MSARATPRKEEALVLRLGFLGLGWIGHKRLEAAAALPEVQIAALADSNPETLEAVQRRYDAALTSCTIEGLLACDLDGVVIATPNGVHAEQAIAFLSRGVPVFCQKPLATTSADCARVIEVAQRADRLLGVDYCYRHVQGMDELRRCLAAGQLGTIGALDLTFHNAYAPDKRWCFDPQVAGGGCLLDLGIHLIDLAQWLLGEEPLRLVSRNLFARGRSAVGSEIEDLAFAEFRQGQGALVRLACSWNSHTGRDAVIGLRVLGATGGAAWRNVNGSFYDFELDLFRGAGRERLGGFPDDWGGRALQAWVQQLSIDRSFDPQAWNFLRSAQLIDAVYAR